MALVGTTSFYEVILAVIVIAGSQFMTKFIRFLYLNRFDFFVFTFCFMVLFQDNPKLVEARFV